MEVLPPLPYRRTVRTRICIISDTHCTFPTIPPCDILIHCGDLTDDGRFSQLQYQFQRIAAAPAEMKLVIPGNHDITLDREYYARMGKTMHSGKLEDLDACAGLWSSDLARAKNVRYLEEGMSMHELKNGARFTVYSSPYQPEFCNWAFPYRRHEDRFNATPAYQVKNKKAVSIGGNLVPDYPNVDVMITHGPPMEIFDVTTRSEAVGCWNLMTAVTRAKPILHCFGHIHEGWGAAMIDWRDHTMDWHATDEDAIGVGANTYKYINVCAEGRSASLVRGLNTEFVNASIMDVKYQPKQLPFLVDVDLPVREH